MSTYGEKVPICTNCPMRTMDFSGALAEFNDEVLIESREAAVNITYNTNDTGGAPWKLEDRLKERGASVELAELAVSCLGHMMRRYCLTADYHRNDNGLMEVTARVDL